MAAYMCTRERAAEIETLNTPEPGRPHHDRPSACVIAQQYSPAIFDLIALSFPPGKIWRAFQKCYLVVYFLLN
jgi:hypothetical protein